MWLFLFVVAVLFIIVVCGFLLVVVVAFVVVVVVVVVAAVVVEVMVMVGSWLGHGFVIIKVILSVISWFISCLSSS